MNWLKLCKSVIDLLNIDFSYFHCYLLCQFLVMLMSSYCIFGTLKAYLKDQKENHWLRATSPRAYKKNIVKNFIKISATTC